MIVIVKQLKVIFPLLCLFLMVFLFYTLQKYRASVLNEIRLYTLVRQLRDQCHNTQPTLGWAPITSSSQATTAKSISRSRIIEEISSPPDAKASQDTEVGLSQAHDVEPISSSQVSKTVAKRIQTFLLTMIISAPQNKQRRDSIRRTWKNSYVEQGKQFLVKFVIGTLGLGDEDKKSLVTESEQYNDVLLLTDHIDSYNNLTRKVLHMFVWADHSVNFSYLLKTDDDAFVRLDAIESELKARTSNESKPLYWGYSARDKIPHKQGKWKEEHWDICKEYLPYVLGGGYVLSTELIHRVAISADGLVLYSNEDVSVGAWVSPYRLELKDDTRFDMYKKVKHKCDNYLILTGQSTAEMETRYNLLNSTGFLCKMKENQ